MSEVYSTRELAEAIAEWRPEIGPFGGKHPWDGLTEWVDNRLVERLVESGVPDRRAVYVTSDFLHQLKRIEQAALELAQLTIRMPDIEQKMISLLQRDFQGIRTIDDVL